MQDKYHAVLEQFTEAKSEFENIRDMLGTAQCLRSIGNRLFMQDWLEEANTYLDHAKSTFETIGEMGTEQCLQGISDVLRMQGRLDEASRRGYLQRV